MQGMRKAAHIDTEARRRGGYPTGGRRRRTLEVTERDDDVRLHGQAGRIGGIQLRLKSIRSRRRRAGASRPSQPLPMKIAMLPRDIAPAPNWIVPVLSLASIWFIYAAFGWTGVAVMGVAPLGGVPRVGG